MGERSIFEDVGGSRADAHARPAPGAAAAAKLRDRGRLRLWFIILAAGVALMVAVGGMTRLTDSGLAITEWNLVPGAVPPLSAADWESEFEAYRQIPEYQLVNRGMSLEEFKTIYWWEWGHRQLGRALFLVWLIPFLWLLARRRIPAGWTGRSAAVGGLIVAQGALGWWMVASGLTERVDVASYRLAAHLGMAFALFALLVWWIAALGRDAAEALQARRRRVSGPVAMSGVLLGALFLQVLLGALVAGIDAGRGYIDWPLMGGEVLPSESFDYVPFWANFFENPALVQFNHRIVGYAVLAIAVGFWMSARRAGMAGLRRWGGIALTATLAQVVLGVATVMHAAPVALALPHQLLALALVGIVVRARAEALYPAQQWIERGHPGAAR